MKKIAIVGAGQAGLQLGFELLHRGFAVTLYTDKDAHAVLNSAPPPVPIQFAPSLHYEAELGLDFWSAYPATHIEGVRFDLYAPDGNKVFTIQSALQCKGQTVDLRLKFSVWLGEFTRRGGNLVIGEADIAVLEEAAQTHDAVFVATGKGALARLFEKDAGKCIFDKPQRNVALFYARDCQLNYRDNAASGGSFNIMQGMGELLMSPFLSKDKERIYYVLVEAIPGSALDRLDKTAGAEAQFGELKQFLASHFPPLFAMIKDATLVNNEWLSASITPAVKKPVGTLPSGKVVMAIGDLLILNDPLMAQGLNGASKMARYLGEKIAESENEAFTAGWINRVFDGYWQTAQYNNLLTAAMLGEPALHQQQLLFAASQNAPIAEALVNGIGNAYTMWPWFGDAAEAGKFMREKGFAMA
jgi:2-polyprenyl-6-methoxyphenol hydroxylase-like FAD-dependent oxidoreductase